MTIALKALVAAFLAVHDNLVPLIGANLIWFVLCLPVLLLAYPLGAPFMVALFCLLVVMPNPMSAGVHCLASKLANEELAPFDLFWSGLRSYFWRSVRLFILNLILLLVLLVAAYFYLSQPGFFFKVLGLLFGYGLVIWLAVQSYLLPLLLRQEDKRLLLVMRNAALISVRYWAVTLFLTAFTAFLVALGIALTLAVPLVLMSLLALLWNHGLKLILVREVAAKRL